MHHWTAEWENRLACWRDALLERRLHGAQPITWEHAITTAALLPEQVDHLAYAPVAPGARWGAEGDSGWFRSTLIVPADWAGRALVAMIDVGSEICIWVDGQARGGRSLGATRVELCAAACAGQRIALLVEGFKRTHIPGWRGGWRVPGQPDPTAFPAPQATLQTSAWGIWEEAVFQLQCDVDCLVDLRHGMEAPAARRQAIQQALAELTLRVDPEADLPEFLAQVEQGRRDLAPLLMCGAQGLAQRQSVVAFGHGHLDIAWKWTLAQGATKMVRTTAQQLELIDRYPEHRFLQPQPALYEMLRRRNPQLHARLLQQVAAGRVIADGGMYVEADTNLVSGESLVRQCVYGRRYFRDELGVDSRLLWLPDAFGYSAALPQIARLAGLRYFVTAKLRMNYHDADPFPYDTFLWQGLDGSTLPAHLLTSYSNDADLPALADRFRCPVAQATMPSKLHPFGWGDGGGGPIREHLESMRRLADVDGAPRCRMDAPARWFDEHYPQHWPDERYVGELYLSGHRGVYTSQARLKLLNRRCEEALREAECWGALAACSGGFAYPAARIEAAWKQVLVNQFHDILPGSCARLVAEEAERDYEAALATAAACADAARAALCAPGPGRCVFNSLSWEREAWITVPTDERSWIDAQGRVLPCQQADGAVQVRVRVPACGSTSIEPTTAAVAAAAPTALVVRDRLLENEHLRVELNDAGELIRVLDKESGLEVLRGHGNRFVLFQDVPSRFDAWDIDSMYRHAPLRDDGATRIRIGARGPHRVALHLDKNLGHSELHQEISLEAGSRQVEFTTTIDWQEQHRLLKVFFDLNYHSVEALHEIAFGHLARPTHASRPHDRDRFEVCQHRWTALCEAGRGAALLNDSKYGISVAGSQLGLSLLRAPLVPDALADRGRHRFRSALRAWNGPLLGSGLVQAGYEFNLPLSSRIGSIRTASFASCDHPGVIIDTLKPAFDGSGDLILRCYESLRSRCRARLRLAMPGDVLQPCDLMEDALDAAPIARAADGQFLIEFGACQIRSFRLAAGRACGGEAADRACPPHQGDGGTAAVR